MFVKVCGVKTEEQIKEAIRLGYDAIGIVLHSKSKRYVEAAEAVKLAMFAKNKILTVAVGITNAEVEPVAERFDHTQTYEVNDSVRHIYAGINPPESYHSKVFLYDTSKGSGENEAFPDWIKDTRLRIILAGGLNAENVAKTIRAYNPYGVDVSSGVETDGVKDFEKMKNFIKEVRNAC